MILQEQQHGSCLAAPATAEIGKYMRPKYTSVLGPWLRLIQAMKIDMIHMQLHSHGTASMRLST